jgi:hypothetical protein
VTLERVPHYKTSVDKTQASENETKIFGYIVGKKLVGKF